MPCPSLSKEPPCQSPLDTTSTGCCADGRQCDEVCIAIVAAEECKQSGRACAGIVHNADECCREKKDRPCKQPDQSGPIQQSSDKQGSCCQDSEDNFTAKGSIESPGDQCNDDDQGGFLSKIALQESCCTDNPNNCTSKRVSNCCANDIEATQDRSSTEVAGDGCCKCEKELGDKEDRYNGLRYSGYCKGVTAVADEHVAECSDKLDSCCRPKAVESMYSVATCADASVVIEFQEACSSHLAEAMNRYRAYLERGICICRNALRQVDICCDQNSRAAISSKRKISSDVTKYCTTDKYVQVKRCKNEDVKKCEKKKCCSEKKPVKPCTEVQHLSQKSCCSAPKDNFDSIAPTNASCEPVVNGLNIHPKSSQRLEVSGNIQDLESHAAREHVTFGIIGMTCTGCVKKVMGVLGNIDGVNNARVNFVAAIGDMDVDNAKVAATQVLQRLEKETGFKLSRIISDYQVLDLMIASSAAQTFEANLPNGVESIEKVGTDLYRISYNPLLIGARAVLARSDGHMAPPNNDGAVSEGQRRLLYMLWSFLGATLFTIPVCVLAFSNAPIPLTNKNIVEFVLATVVQLIAIPHFYAPALKALIFSKTIEMDMLVVISITAAYCYSIVAFSLEVTGIHLEQGPLFETSTLLITLVLLGRLVASYAKVKAVQAVSLKSLQAENALLEDVHKEVTEVDARLLEFDDVVRIPAHSKIVSDGQVISGESAVDESMLTGESLPVPKTTGDTVTAGTLNGPGLLRIRLTRLPGKNSITDIAELVQNALNSKPRVQDLADVVAGYFVPVVVSIAVIVLGIWIAVALRIRNQNGGGAVGIAITYTVAVLAISCPCALGLAVPLVLVVSGGVAARNGVIIKQGDATERGFKVTDVVFDKTGTLTTGQLEVKQQDIHECNLSSEEGLAVAYSLVKDDTHPVAQAVAAKLRSQGVSDETVEAITSVPGCGVEAVWNGREVKAGNPYWLGIDTFSPVAVLQAQGYTLLCIMIDGQLVASFGLVATIRPEAHFVVAALQVRGLTCHIVSGDQPAAVSSVAISLGIHSSNTASRQSPARKQTYIQNLKTAGKTTLFVGDGTNDAVAIAAANVGVQIGAASDVTRATADVVLLGGLEGIITLLEVSKQSFYRIIFNFVWSGVYNLFAILLASGAFVKIRIAPNYAGLGEIVSVLPVVFAALTMLL